MTHSSDVSALRAAHRRVLERIAAAAERAGRDPSEVQLVAASKSVAAERLRAAIAAGITTFGENRVQEAEAKVKLVPDARWHMIGRLQSNKATRAAQLFDVVESVDSLALAERLSSAVQELGDSSLLTIYLQVNVDRDPDKAGFDSDELATTLPQITRLPALELAGLMTVGRLVDQAEEARPTFRALRELSEGLRARETALGAGLSMGMSDDFEAAVQEGATLVRVGRALFGDRPPD